MQGKRAVQYIDHMELHLIFRPDLILDLVFLTLSLYDQYSLPPTSFVWFHDKIFRPDGRKRISHELLLVCDSRISFRERDSATRKKVLRFELTISEGNGFSGIHGPDILQVTGIHSKNTVGKKLH